MKNKYTFFCKNEDCQDIISVNHGKFAKIQYAVSESSEAGLLDFKIISVKKYCCKKCDFNFEMIPFQNLEEYATKFFEEMESAWGVYLNCKNSFVQEYIYKIKTGATAESLRGDARLLRFLNIYK